MARSTQAEIVSMVADKADNIRFAFRIGAEAAAVVLNGEEELTPDVFQRVCSATTIAIDTINAQARTQVAKNNLHIGCRDRCHWCCFQHVVISASEAFGLALAIADPVAERLRIAQAAGKIATLDHTERFNQAVPCPLLKDKRCSAYEHRPQACRSYFSLSRTACERDWGRRNRPRNPNKKEIPLLGEPPMYAESINMGCDWALLAASGGKLQVLRGELSAMLAVALGDGALTAWLDGEAVFPADIFCPRHLVYPIPYAEVLQAAASQAGMGAED